MTALTEIFIYRGSHNLIPFELIMYFLHALPCVIGVYISKLIQANGKAKKKAIMKLLIQRCKAAKIEVLVSRGGEQILILVLL